MRWFHLAVIIVLAAAILIFAAQNFQSVAISFLAMSARTPLAFLVVVVYLLGAATGSSVLTLLRRSIEGSRRGRAPT